MRRQGRIEDEHFTLATTLLASLKEKVLDTPKFFEDMAPKTAVELLAKLIGIQRISVGLPAAGPLALKETQEEQTFEMLIRSMGRAAANAAGGGGNTFDQNGGLVNQGKEMVNKILGDPENAAMLQEVVIRVTSASRNEKAKEGRDVTGGFQGRAFKSRGRTNEILSNEDLQPYDVTGAPGAGEDDG
jgi:hypothetical protein